jgi:hypothetical protein
MISRLLRPLPVAVSAFVFAVIGYLLTVPTAQRGCGDGTNVCQAYVVYEVPALILLVLAPILLLVAIGLWFRDRRGSC